MSYSTSGFLNRPGSHPIGSSGFSQTGVAFTTAKNESDSEGPSVQSAFRTMLADIEITEADRSHASAQQQLLRERLERELYVADTFLTGSYRRYTIRRPLNDIDLFVVLNSDIYGENIPLTRDGAEAALDLLEDALRKLYPRSEVKRHDRCIQISFSNTGIGFDVIPAYQTSRDEFWIPDGPRGWIKTNPKEQQSLVTKANQDRCDCMLVPAVKLIKTFNIAHGKLLNGFHVEAMVYHALQYAPLSHEDSVSFLFQALSRAVLVTTPDIWPEGEPADRYLTYDKRLGASIALDQAAINASDAVAAERDGRIDAAHAWWYEIFGDDYPEQGLPQQEMSTALPLSALAAVDSIRSGRRSSATSAGLVTGGPNLFARSSTSHGGELETAPAPHYGIAESISDEHRERLEREIKRAQAQFTLLRRLDPEVAAADPKLWPVTPVGARELYAVLVGEQRSNLGHRHRILVAIPKRFPAVEAQIFPLVHRVRNVPGSRGFRPLRRYKHLWRDGSMCSHAGRDGWDGRLVTLLVYAADWLVRQDYYQLTGVWVGAEIGKRGELRINGSPVFGRTPRRSR